MRVIRVTARAGATPSSPLRRMSESTLTCFALSATLIWAGEPKTSLASPSARIPRSSGPRRNSACRRVAWSRSTVIGPATRQGVGASSPGAVPVSVAAPANRRPPSPAAGSPSSAPSNSAAGQLGPASTERRSGVPSGPGFSEASLKTTGALSGPENWPLRCAGPSSDGAAASISTPEISASGGGADDLHAPIPHAKAVKPGRVEARHLHRRQFERAVRPAREGQNGLLETNVGEPDLPARKLDERELQPRRGERQLRPVRAWRADQTFAQREIGRRQHPKFDRPGQGDVRARDCAEPRLDLAALRRPVDEVRRDERNRHHRDERDRDDGQDIAHREMTSTPLGRTVARTIRRPSRFKMPRKYDLDNKSGVLRFMRPIGQRKSTRRRQPRAGR